MVKTKISQLLSIEPFFKVEVTKKEIKRKRLVGKYEKINITSNKHSL